MKTVFASLISMLFFQTTFAQVTGRLVSSAGQAVPFANVLLVKSTDSSLVKAALTNEQGTYLLETIAPGAYRLRVSSLGYQTWNSPVFELNTAQSAKEFGTLILQEDSKQLSEVVIRAEKPLFEQRTEGTVVHVESSVLSKGSSVFQLLERSPGVVIDYQNGGITLNGKAGVTVMLNGKPMRMPVEQVVAMLNGMSANDVATIELLTTPGARYDAEGSGGVINIVRKKNTKPGTNGSFSLTGGYGWGEKGTGSFNLAHTTKTVSVYGSYSFLHDRTYSDMYVDSWQNMPVLGGKLHALGTDTTNAVQNNHDFTLGFDARPHSKTTFGGSMNANSSARSATDFNRLSYTILPDSVLLFQGIIDGTNRWKNVVSSVYADHKMGDGEQLTGALDYLYFTNRSPTEVRSSFVTENGEQIGNNDGLFAPLQRGFANTTIRVGVAKLDYTKQFSTKTRLEVGAKGTFTRNRSGSGIESLIGNNWVGRSETTNEIVMNEGIGAVYTSVNSQISPAINLVLGLRYEYSRTHMANPETAETVVDRKRGVLFPSLFMTRKVGGNSELQFSYTKRISRPSYTDLASFVRYSDPSAVYAGNPLLKPTLTNTMKLGVTHRGYSFSLLFSRDDNPIARYQLTEGPARNLLYVSPQNLSWQNSLTFQASLPLKVTNWWEMNYGFTGGPRWFKAIHPPKAVQKTYIGYSATASQSFKLPRRFSAELSGWYNSYSFNGTTKVGAMGALNVGVKKELKNNGGTVQVAVTDLLQTMRINVFYGTITEEAFSIKNHVSINTESRMRPILKLTYSRPFGSGTQKSQGRQNAGSQEERDRVQKN